MPDELTMADMHFSTNGAGKPKTNKSWMLQHDDADAVRVICPIEEKEVIEEELKTRHAFFLGYTTKAATIGTATEQAQVLEMSGSWLLQGRVLTVLWKRTPDGQPRSRMTRDAGPPKPTADLIKEGKIQLPPVAPVPQGPVPATPAPKPKPKTEPPQEVPIPA